MDGLLDQAEAAELLSSPEVVEAAFELAERAAEYWQSIAPVDTGEYKDSIHAVLNGDVAAVVCGSESAAIIEYGTATSPEFACRARTESHFNA